MKENRKYYITHSGSDLDEERPYAILQVRSLPKPPPLRLEEDGRVF